MLNTAILMGRLTADPELKHTANSSVTNFTLAVSRTYVRAGQERQTDFIDIVAWGKTAEMVCRYFGKGQLMAVQGRIETRTYEDKNGNKRKVFEIIAENVHFAESKKDGAQRQSSSDEAGSQVQAYSNANYTDFQEMTGNDDDLPF